MLGHAFDHVTEIVFGVDVDAVGVDADEFHALGGVLVGGGARRLVGADDVGAVVAGEEDDQRFGVIKAT